MSKDYERKVQTSETLIQVAMIRLLLARLARHLRTSSQPSALGHKPFPMAFGDTFDDAINLCWLHRASVRKVDGWSEPVLATQLESSVLN
jgi:hypothetical protein